MPGSDSGSSVYSDLEREKALEESEDERDVGDGEEPDYYDTSDEEDLRNTIGNIPVSWYDEHKHIGYDLKGRPIQKPEGSGKSGEIDKFLERMEDPNFWRKVRDLQTGSEMVLKDEELQTVANLQSGRYPAVGYNPYEPFLDLYSHEVEQHPLSNRPDHKRSFIPSKTERQMVSKMVHAIKMGWIKPKKPKELTEDESRRKFYDLWESTSSQDPLSKNQLARLKMHIPPPKVELPGDEESYNPPPEYLFTPEEKKAWNEQEPETRRINFVPQKYNCLRHVPGYPRFVQERFQRCMDLFLAPRRRVMKLNVNPDDLLPKLPNPEDLRPFPTTSAIVYQGHTDIVRTITVSPCGQYIASGSDDGTIKIWEISTGRCLRTVPVLDGNVTCLAWCPNKSLSLLCASIEKNVHLLNPLVGDKVVTSATDSVLQSQNAQEEPKDSIVKWTTCEDRTKKDGYRIYIEHSKPVGQVTWHIKGDYFASVEAEGNRCSVIVHQLSKRKSQPPISSSKFMIQKVLFHPLQPLFFVATQRFVRVYNLVKQELVKKLIANCQHISSIALHPKGDNVIVGSYDSRVVWFDLDLSVKPYQTLRYHKQAVRATCFHAHYPLFASCSDDGRTIVSHGMVYNDFKNALIVPVKELRGHKKTKNICVTDCQFHPTQPWIFTAGADSTIRLFL